jgi:hypothetical protein
MFAVIFEVQSALSHPIFEDKQKSQTSEMNR